MHIKLASKVMHKIYIEINAIIRDQHAGRFSYSNHACRSQKVMLSSVCVNSIADAQSNVAGFVAAQKVEIFYQPDGTRVSSDDKSRVNSNIEGDGKRECYCCKNE